jgi:hypothetical protein
MDVFRFISRACIRKIIVEGLRVFINFALSNLKNSSGGRIRCLSEQ